MTQSRLTLPPNPWLEITAGQLPYCTTADRPLLEQHNRRVEALHRCPLDVYPEPYIGDPRAPVLLLNLNPGYNSTGPPMHARPAVADLCLRNLRHECERFPFYPMNPIYLQNGGSDWWSKSLGHWIDEYGPERVSRAFFVVEMFPYASPRYRGLREPLPSQEYSLTLVRAKVASGGATVIMRQENNWKQLVPELRSGSYVVKNPQSKSLAPAGERRRGNLPPDAAAAIHAALATL